MPSRGVSRDEATVATFATIDNRHPPIHESNPEPTQSVAQVTDPCVAAVAFRRPVARNTTHRSRMQLLGLAYFSPVVSGSCHAWPVSRRSWLASSGPHVPAG